MPERDVHQMPRARLTYDDLVRLPDDGLRHELIDGEHYVTPAPKPRHQMVVANLSHALTTHVRAHRSGLVLVAPLDIIIDARNVVQPDIVYLAAGQLRDINPDVALTAVPRLVIEVSSPATRNYEETVKREFCESIGVAEFWFVDAQAATVSTYVREERGSGFAVPAVLRASSDALTTTLLPGLRIALSDVFDLHQGDHH